MQGDESNSSFRPKQRSLHRRYDGNPANDWHVCHTTPFALRNGILLSHADIDVHTWLGVALHRRPFVKLRGDSASAGRPPSVLARRARGEQCHVLPRIGVDARVVSEAQVHRSPTTSQRPFMDNRDRRSLGGPRGCVPWPGELQVTFLRPRLGWEVWQGSGSLNLGLTAREPDGSVVAARALPTRTCVCCAPLFAIAIAARASRPLSKPWRA